MNWSNQATNISFSISFLSVWSQSASALMFCVQGKTVLEWLLLSRSLCICRESGRELLKHCPMQEERHTQEPTGVMLLPEHRVEGELKVVRTISRLVPPASFHTLHMVEPPE